MRIAKKHLDVGLFARDIDAHLTYWKDTVKLVFDHTQKLGGGIHQHRFHMNGSILKVNHSRHTLHESTPSGIVGLRIAAAGLVKQIQLFDPDGNRVSLVPIGDSGVTGIGIELRVNNRDAHDRFWRHVMQFDSPSPGEYVCGNSRIIICEEANVGHMATWQAYGWRYLTVQVIDCQVEHRGVLDRGGDESEPPRRMGDVATVSFVRDPDGNFIELSQRSSLLA